ncbi:MAG: carbamoyltransferase HypF [Pirellulaceae bacterium]
MTQTQTVAPVVVRMLLRGLVQGQGIRPTIARIAAFHGIAGTVRNTSQGVEVVALGDPAQIDAFQAELGTCVACVSLVASATETFGQPTLIDFKIIESEPGQRLQTIIPLDLAVCSDCLAEVRSPANRRYRYPFTTCTRCGPRYSILKQMPFDRHSTSMAQFPMCEQCESEYRDPKNRRFHAQTIACPDCGPKCWATDRDGIRTSSGFASLEFVVQQITRGRIAAIKGIGGYQFLCDATNEIAVRTLRRRKQRPTKPLPIMVRDLDQARMLASTDVAQQEALQSPANPIVLLRVSAQRELSSSLSPNLNSIGVVLPSSPLHALLIDLAGKPLVVTSGNVSGLPLTYRNDNATSELAEIADVFLHHDREIERPIDDSVVQCVAGTAATIRAARGIAPLTISSSTTMPMIATGGHQKVAPAISNGNDFVLSPHIGDMETESSRVRFHDSIQWLQSLCRVPKCDIVSDQHPGYFTHQWRKSKFTVQHHHAHVAAAMLEHGLMDQTVLGIAFDGTGLGDDGTIWGGEALLATTSSHLRVGHLRPFRLPGGENAIKHPMRIAESLRSQMDDSTSLDPSTRYAIETGIITTSMGRLFDGISAMVLGIDSVPYEGEAAMQLEAACDPSESTAYAFPITQDGPIQFDWRPVVKAIRSDLGSLSPGAIAMKFHRAVAKLVVDVAQRHPDHACVVTGGVFQNRMLLELIDELAIKGSVDIRLPGRIPVNDGGLSIGQLVVASQCQRIAQAREGCV